MMWIISSMLGAATVRGHITLISEGSGRHAGADLTTVVWLSPLSSPFEPSSSPPLQHARMVQKNKSFEPHILAIKVGDSVDFPNLDPIFHNAFSNFDGQLFDIGLYPPGSSRTIRFRREGRVRVFCNIHPAMSAVILVLATPYFNLTDTGNNFIIPDVAPGEYKLHFFHERATPETLDALSQTIMVSGSSITLGDIRISEAGYIPTPHKNKYGRDYPPAEQSTYHQ